MTKKCPHLEFILFEKVGNSFKTETDSDDFRDDYKKIRTIINNAQCNYLHKEWGNESQAPTTRLTDLQLFNQQQELRKNLYLQNTHLIADWDSDMWVTATKLNKKWNNR